MERTQSDNSRSRRMDKFCVQDAICECGVGVKKKKIFGKPRFNVYETQSIALQYWAMMLGILFLALNPRKNVATYCGICTTTLSVVVKLYARSANTTVLLNTATLTIVPQSAYCTTKPQWGSTFFSPSVR